MKPTEQDSPDRGLNPRAPRWVKVSGIVAVVLVLLFVVLHLTGVHVAHH